ncbi:MAG: hypothetical protein ACRD3M_19415 [Thermoanaerobaculia bacterium]
MRGTRARPDARARAAVLAGVAASFVAAVDLARLLRPGLLLDPDTAWLLPRLGLGLAVVAAAAAAGGIAAAAFWLLSRTRLLAARLPPLPLSPAAAALLAAGALAAGLLVRFLSAAALEIPFLEDEVNLVTPALELTGTSRDFSDSIRPIPYGRSDPHEMIGVLYLALLRRCLELAGTTVFAIRLPSLLGGALSLVTGTLLARRLLPRGGTALAALTLAGLRWHLILSFSGWHSILIAPLVDVAALLLLSARRRGTRLPAALAGIAAGIGPHLYLAAWASSAGLLAFCLWPGEGPESRAWRAARGALFAAGFLLAVAPLFLFDEGRKIPYFGRTARHSVLREMRIAGSLMPALAAAADALPAPWLLPDPEGRHDLEGASRLGWIVGLPVAVALARALCSPRAELSAVLLTQAAAAFGAAVAGGQAGHPNGFRFGYLTTWTAMAAGAGALAAIGLAPPPKARAATLAALGLLLIAGARGVREAAVLWPSRHATFDSFHGEDTLVGQAAARWQRYGSVAVEPGLGRSDSTIDTVRRYRLQAGPVSGPGSGPLTDRASRRFRVARGGAGAAPGERVVERVRDAWGREWAIVLGRPADVP